MNGEEIFGSFILILEFNLSQINKIKPKQLDKLNIKQMISKGNENEIKGVIEDLSYENFEENGNF